MVDDVLGIQKCSSKSRKLNNAINTFIELEKLTLSQKKCHNVHVGKDCRTVQTLTFMEKKWVILNKKLTLVTK